MDVLELLVMLNQLFCVFWNLRCYLTPAGSALYEMFANDEALTGHSCTCSNYPERRAHIICIMLVRSGH